METLEEKNQGNLKCPSGESCKSKMQNCLVFLEHVEFYYISLEFFLHDVTAI